MNTQASLSHAQTVFNMFVAEQVDQAPPTSCSRHREIITAYKGQQQLLNLKAWRFPDDSALMWDQDGWWIGEMK